MDNMVIGDSEIKKFVELVRKMRDAQKRYFKTRDKTVLSESKALERDVDSWIQERMNGQTKLF